MYTNLKGSTKPTRLGASHPAPVTSVLRQSGQTLPSATQSDMEKHFGHDFGQVRIHADDKASTAASAIHARAFTFGQHIVFGRGQFRPQQAKGKLLLAHELAHVIQQKQGGSPPPFHPNAQHEQEANSVSKSIVNNHTSTQVQYATGTGIVRTPEEWLDSNPNAYLWTYTQLIDEINDIRAWLGRQRSTNEKTHRLTKVLQELLVEVNRRESTVQANLTPKKKKRIRRTRHIRPVKKRKISSTFHLPKPRILFEKDTGVNYKNEAEVRYEYELILSWLKRRNLNSQDRFDLLTERENLAAQLPKARILKERQSVAYRNQEEMVREYNLIIESLQRPDLSQEDRQALLGELQALQKAMGKHYEKEVAIRRAKNIQKALRSSVNNNPRQQLIHVLSLIEGIKPMPEKPGFSLLIRGNEGVILHHQEVQYIRQQIIDMMDRSLPKIKEKIQGAQLLFKEQRKVNKEQGVVSRLVGLFTKHGRGGPTAAILHPILLKHQLRLYEAAKLQGQLVAMGRALSKAEESAAKALFEVKNWTNESINVAGKYALALSITRDLALSISTSYLSGAGFVGLVKSGASLLRAGAMIVGTATTANALVRGGANLLLQSTTGGPLNTKALGKNLAAGSKIGAVSSLTGIFTGGLAYRFGPGTAFSGRVIRGTGYGGAGGFAGSTSSAILEGKPPGEVIKLSLKGTGLGMLGGGVGAGIPGSSSFSAWRRAVISSLSGGAVDAGVTALAGGSRKDIWQAFALGAMTSGLVSSARQAGPKSAQSQSPTNPKRTKTNAPSPSQSHSAHQSPDDVQWKTLIGQAKKPVRRQQSGGFRSQLARIGNKEVIIIEGRVGNLIPQTQSMAKGSSVLSGEHGTHAVGMQLGENLPEGVSSAVARFNTSDMKVVENNIRRVADIARPAGIEVETRTIVKVQHIVRNGKKIPLAVGVERKAWLRLPGSDQTITFINFSAQLDPTTRQIAIIKNEQIRPLSLGNFQ